MKPRAVGFDAGGTLFDLAACLRAGRRAVRELLTAEGCSEAELTSAFAELARLNANLDDRANRSSFRATVEKNWTSAIPPSVRTKITATRICEISFAKHPHMPLYDDAIPAVETLRGAGLRLGILSNADPDWYRESIHALGPLHTVVRVNNTTTPKPALEAFLSFAAAMETSPEEMLYVGDSWNVDVLPALRAGMHAVFLDRSEKAAIDLEGTRAANPGRLVARITSLHQLGALVTA